MTKARRLIPHSDGLDLEGVDLDDAPAAGATAAFDEDLLMASWVVRLKRNFDHCRDAARRHGLSGDDFLAITITEALRCTNA